MLAAVSVCTPSNAHSPARVIRTEPVVHGQQYLDPGTTPACFLAGQWYMRATSQAWKLLIEDHRCFAIVWSHICSVPSRDTVDSVDSVVLAALMSKSVNFTSVRTCPWLQIIRSSSGATGRDHGVAGPPTLQHDGLGCSGLRHAVERRSCCPSAGCLPCAWPSSASPRTGAEISLAPNIFEHCRL